MTETTEQVKKIPNPEGKGGFQDHPELRNSGGRPKNNESFNYWYGVFKNMTVKELDDWQHANGPEIRTVAADLAFTRIYNSKTNLKEFKEVANRSEGVPIPTQIINIQNNTLISLDEAWKLLDKEIENERSAT
jgi:hypothetical protein